MSEQDRYIPGVPCWVETLQPDAQAARDFYGALFHWQSERSWGLQQRPPTHCVWKMKALQDSPQRPQLSTSVCTSVQARDWVKDGAAAPARSVRRSRRARSPS